MRNFDVNLIKISEPVVIDVIAEDLSGAQAAALDICEAGISELEKEFDNKSGRVDIDVKR